MRTCGLSKTKYFLFGITPLIRIYPILLRNLVSGLERKNKYGSGQIWIYNEYRYA